MTIRVEREALLRVISRAPSPPSSSLKRPLIQQPEDEEFVVVELPDTKYSFFYDDLIPGSTDDDQASLCSLSTDSVTTSTTSATTLADEQRRVSFAPDLVTAVWTREKTLPEDISLLYYSSQETQTVCGF
jgi:hypothetical protein